MIQLVKASLPKTTSIRVNSAEGLPPIRANASQIRQVVLNLIVNASEALEAKPGTVAVATSRIRVGECAAESRRVELPEGDYVLLEVTDEGCGMTEEVKARIFDPFYSTKFLGRGMGLAAVLGIVRGTGGAIRVTSAPGQGSTFRVWLPCSQARDGGAIAQVRSGQTGTVLLVDDEDVLRAAVARALKREGFSVLEARDGLAGVQLFARHCGQIDVVVLDQTLPGLSGHDVCEEMRRLQPDVRVLFCSAQACPVAEEPGQRYLGKPYRLRELIRTIREMMAAGGG
jgi:CheY-like chemotaxis protein